MTPPAVVTVIQGAQHVARRDDVVLSTLLGSCVAACLWDEEAEVGGMNHFLLPVARTRDDARQNLGRGAHAMELLINGLLNMGARRGRMRAKLFGGAAIREGLTAAGEENAAFAERFLATESIPLCGGSLRGRRGRRLQFWPMSGRARQSWMGAPDAANFTALTPRMDASGDLELFA